ncbi:unnamed protein product [Dovyalis caffra]|uniref:F-box domain-containing protein n=1 Tax=Dovyalis caffra TaxID=77055 RepID=A0AAV1QSY4_9ROSI|nr:unnamed protein product [Dovyalis caffra]
MAASYSYFPEDIIIEILLRLPVKSLLRFRSVSKQWFSLTTNPKFITTHLHHSTENPSLLIARRECVDFIFKTHISLLPNGSTRLHGVHVPNMFGSPFNFVGSDGGLICIQLTPLIYFNYVLWNPATRQFRHIPKSPTYFTHKTCLAFDAFGYSSETNDYKLLLIWYYQEEGVYQAEVFSRRTGSWKVIDKPVPYGFHSDDPPLSLKGEIYWHAGRYVSGNLMEIIVGFNLVTEDFRKIDLPSLEFRSTCYTVTEYKGSLALLIFPRNMSLRNYGFELWVISEEGGGGGGNRESWNKVFTLKEPFLGISRRPEWVFRGSILLFTSIFEAQDGFYLLDPTNPSLQASKFVPMSRPTNTKYGFGEFCYNVESLASVYGENESD